MSYSYSFVVVKHVGEARTSHLLMIIVVLVVDDLPIDLTRHLIQFGREHLT